MRAAAFLLVACDLIAAPFPVCAKLGILPASGRTGVQEITGLGFAPRAVFFWTADVEADRMASPARFARGWADGKTQGVAATAWDDCAGMAAGRIVDDACIMLVDGSGIIVCEAALGVFSPDGFSLHWRVPREGATVLFVALGGTELTHVQAGAMELDGVIAGDRIEVDGLEFMPDTLLAAGVQGARFGVPARAGQCFGVARGPSDRHGVAAGLGLCGNGTRGLTNAWPIAPAGENGAPQVAYNLASMDERGFTLVKERSECRDGVAAIALAMKGLKVARGILTQPDAPGAQAVTGLGFTPALVLFDGAGTAGTHQWLQGAELLMGAATAGGQACVCAAARDASTGVRMVTDAVVAHGVPGAAHAVAEARLGAFTEGGFTLEWTRTDAAARSVGWIAIGAAPADADGLIDFSAAKRPGGVMLEWRTRLETGSLGFHVYRGDVRITPEPLAGGAWSAKGFTGERRYGWLDAAGASGDAYWLEPVNFDGPAAMFGPVFVQAASGRAPCASPSAVLLSRLGIAEHEARWAAAVERMRAATRKPCVAASQIVLEPHGGGPGAFDAFMKRRHLDRWMAGRGRARRPDQLAMAGGPAIKLAIREDGFYRVAWETLEAAGLSATAKPWRLQLIVDEQPVPMTVVGGHGGRFRRQDAIEFYATGQETISTATRVYWLVEGARPGSRIMTQQGASPAAQAMARIGRGRPADAPAPSFPHTVTRRERRIFFAGLNNGDECNFFDGMVTSKPFDVLLATPHVDTAADALAVLDVGVQGVSPGAHVVDVLLNGQALGEPLQFAGREFAQRRITFSHAMVGEGENVLTFVTRSAGDVNLLHHASLTYLHTWHAVDDRLEAPVAGGDIVRIAGFTSPRVRVIDITDPSRVSTLHPLVVKDRGAYTLSLVIPGRGERRILAVAEDRFKSPASIKANVPSSWHDARNGADMVIISHGGFLDAVTPLKAFREGQGWSVAVIDIEDLYDEFSYGQKSVFTLKEFLLHARDAWSTPPRYALLVGDASYDTCNWLGLGDFDLVPTKLVNTAVFETASDDWFGDVDDDGIPEIVVGRLPARTREEAAGMVARILEREQAAERPAALLIADAPSGGFDFGAASEQARVHLPGAYEVMEIRLAQMSASAARAQLALDLAASPNLVGYLGNSWPTFTSKDLMTSAWARELGGDAPLPLFLIMGGYAGMMQDAFTESLAEALMQAEGGAAGVWACSGAASPAGAAALYQEFLRVAFSGEPLVLGDIVARAKAAVEDLDLRRTWMLLGDPLTRVK